MVATRMVLLLTLALVSLLRLPRASASPSLQWPPSDDDPRQPSGDIVVAFFNGTDGACQATPRTSFNTSVGVCTAAPIGLSDGLSFQLLVDEKSNVWHWLQYEFPGCTGLSTKKLTGHGTLCMGAHNFTNGWQLIVTSPILAPCTAQVWESTGCTGDVIQEYGWTPGECFPDHRWGRFSSGMYNLSADVGAWTYTGFSDAGCATPVETDEGPIGECGGTERQTTIVCSRMDMADE
jgi:hypothetical protein